MFTMIKIIKEIVTVMKSKIFQEFEKYVSKLYEYILRIISVKKNIWKPKLIMTKVSCISLSCSDQNKAKSIKFDITID